MSKKNTTAHIGDELINLITNKERADLLKEISLNLSDISLNDHQLCDIELLASGVFSPLDGFMVRSDYESVLDRMQLQDGTLWPIPICLDISKTKAATLEAGQSVALRDPEGFLLAILHIADIWSVDREKEALRIYGTTDLSHPGVSYVFNNIQDYYVGGKLEVISQVLHSDFKQLRMTPYEVRQLYKKLGWKRIVGFHTRNIIHRAQFELTLEAMRRAKANLLLLPITGMTKPGDFDYYTRMRCLKEVIRYYPPETCVMTMLPLFMRLAGARGALFDIIISKNFGCTHFVVGHNHADPGRTSNDKPFYSNGETRKTVKDFSAETGIEIISFKEMVYLPFEDLYKPIDMVPEDVRTISFTGTDIRDRLKTGRKIPDWTTFPKIVEELQKAYPPPGKQGFTIFLTGLSGSGKSTIAKVLYARALEIGERPVTLLDGDIVRRNLSSELTFSKEHRDINVRRIGFVASEITKNRGIAICAPIAPYENTRQEIRKAIEVHGGFIEVHVSTPISECEKRDRKGMYAKARAGLIKGFTGVDDPYEIPELPELSIDTTDISPDEAAQEVLLFLGQKGYI